MRLPRLLTPVVVTKEERAISLVISASDVTVACFFRAHESWNGVASCVNSVISYTATSANRQHILTAL